MAALVLQFALLATLIVVAGTFLQPGPMLHAVETTHAVTACSIIVVTGLAIMGLLYRGEKRYWLFEPNALLVVVLSVASLIAIMFLNGT